MKNSIIEIEMKKVYKVYADGKAIYKATVTQKVFEHMKKLGIFDIKENINTVLTVKFVGGTLLLDGKWDVFFKEI